MLPRLQAEETIEAATTVALGAGTLEKGEARRVAEGLRRRAGGRGAPPADPRTLAMMGIGFEVVGDDDDD